MTYYMLFKRKIANSWKGAIPSKKGTKLEDLRKLVSSGISKQYVAKIITSSQLSKLLAKSKLIVQQKRIRTSKSKKNIKKN